MRYNRFRAQHRGIRGNRLAVRALAVGLLAGLIATAGAGRAHGQAEVRNPSQPILTLDVGGHSAPVTALVFTGNGELLSAGMDKVVNVWDLGVDPPGLARTIRPPVWRGPRGVIYAMALTPEPDAQGQRVLAVAGYGVQSPNGNIGLYRYPGRAGVPTGEVLAQLPAGSEAEAEPRGHWNTVRCLAFAHRGRYLASGSFDRTVRIWDVAARRTVVVLRAHEAVVTALAFSPDGQRLATAAADGVVRLWATDAQRLEEQDRRLAQAADAAGRRRLGDEFNRQALLAEVRPRPGDARPDNPQGVAINALGYSPDGRWVVIGRENGRLIRYDAANLGDERWLPTSPRQGAVEALAFGADGSRLATSIVAQRIGSLADRPRVDCDVELRRMPDGALLGPRFARSNLVYAVAISPDGRRLAAGGGDDQGVGLLDLSAPERRLSVAAGQGWSVWDVGFGPDSRSVGFARQRDDGAAPPSRYWGFDLRKRTTTSFDRGALARARHALADGTTIRPLTPTALEVVDARGAAHRLELDRRTDGRWWSYTFLPPGPGHDRLAVAVGAEAGVIVFASDLAGGGYARTRMLAGHSGAIYALAASPDGRWLATGSSDQTIRLWTLAGCDRRPAFGARFGRGGDGRWRAEAVEPNGFAEAMGLKVGDEVREVYVGGPPAKETAEGLAGLDAAAPELRLEFRVTRGGNVVELGTTKRDQPALSLFVGVDREWVVWTPRGYYDTSIAGDRRYLGWHRNGTLAGGREVDLAAPSDFFTIDRFEKELRRPELIDALVETADPVKAMAQAGGLAVDAPELVRDDAPPAIRIVEPALPAGRPLVVESPLLTVRARVATEPKPENRRQVGAVRLMVDSEVRSTVRPGQAEAEPTVELTLTPGVHRVNVAAENDRGRERLEGFEVEYRRKAEAPEPPPAVKGHAPRLVVVALGAERFVEGGPFTAIAFGAQDARDVARFLTDEKNQGYGPAAPTVLPGPDATVGRLREVLAQLDSERREGALGSGDTVVVMVETHVAAHGAKGLIVGPDTAATEPPAPSLATGEVAEALGALAAEGCRVLVLLDAVHGPDEKGEGRVHEWVRALTKRGVITFVASIQGPGERLNARGHGAFAEAVLGAFRARSQVRVSGPGGSARTLSVFRENVERSVQDLTGLRQLARCYLPGTITGRLAIFSPPVRTALAGEARRGP